MRSLRSSAGNAALGAIIIVVVLGLLGGGYWLFLAPRPGIVEVVGIQALQVDGNAMVRLQVTFVKAPRGGDASHIYVSAYSQAFDLGSSHGMQWADLAAKDDSEATQAGSPPPLGEVITFDLPIQSWVDYGRVDNDQTYTANLDLTWGDDVVLFTDVDITDAISDGGQITVNNVVLSGGETTPAVVDVTFTVDYVPAAGELTDLTLRASSQALNDTITMSWDDIALRDDAAESVPGQAPPVGVPMTIRLHIEPHMRDSITTYNSQSVPLRVAVDWVGRQRDEGSVNIGTLYNF